ncbi:MAG: NAD(P)H-binding protein, partial [Thermodesulfobacteriota bacterium]|nr:NAD(P)H-binding protein [Thermodesulfobacteriota bacterium]
MKNAHRTALVAGATGLTGECVLKQLIEDNTYTRVDVLTRRPLPLRHAKVREHIIDFNRDFNRDSEMDHLFKVDDVFCCLGTTMKKAGSRETFCRVDRDYPVKIASVASQNNARQFLVISALGANPGSMIFYNRTKGEMEQGLKDLPLNTLHIFRPSLLKGNRKEFRFAERLSVIIADIFSFMLIGRL